MKEKVVKIVEKLVWFRKSHFGLRHWPLQKISQFFVIEFVPSAVLSQTILSKKEFRVGSDVYSIWCILTFDNQAFLDQVMKT